MKLESFQRFARLAGSLLLAAVVLAGGVAATEAPPEGAEARPVAEAEWTEIVPGVDFAPAYGVFTEEPHGKWVRFEPELVSPLHTHTHAYHGVVIRGTVINPYEGEEDPPEMGPGDYWYVPGGVAHKTGCVSEEPCLFYTHGDELWDIQLVEEEGAPPAE